MKKLAVTINISNDPAAKPPNIVIPRDRRDANRGRLLTKNQSANIQIASAKSIGNQNENRNMNHGPKSDVSGNPTISILLFPAFLAMMSYRPPSTRQKSSP